MPVVLGRAFPPIPLLFLAAVQCISRAYCNARPYSRIKVSEIEVQASRATALMTDLKRIVPDVEVQLGPLLKVCVVSMRHSATPLALTDFCLMVDVEG